MKTAPPLQRGMACLCCRKRKMKCDGLRPVCTQCLKSNRGTECHYYEKKHISRTQLLQQKVAKLEARLRELEAEQEASTSGSSSSSSPPNLLSTSGDPLDINASIGDTLLLGSGASSVNEWDLRLPSLSLSPPISYGNVSGFSSDIHGEDIAGPSSAVRLDPAAVSRSSSMRPSTSSSSTLKWWEDTSTFCENKQRLCCAFDVHVGRFQASLHSAAPSQPHPALMDAIYLLACYFSRMPQLSELESCFLKRALQGISDALHKQDRMVHVLQAACLIAVYFFCQGRVLEGYYHSSTSARLAIDLGLHQLHPSDGHIVQTSAAGLPHHSIFPVEATFPLPPPADTIEHAERIAAFWQIFIIDRAWSVATGLPSALPDDDHPRSQIETLWPMSVADMSLVRLVDE
ncbi:hypothetical protein WOLCODRAFT_88184 [Wolfiporia cocos MD-104 SS10]|uniref:Zn(2)-C6 fungal-type domain-containing protein n=1 Tax=Wolfiporia cocos (strain MD-104) TaxID=742152 RepID=A0A2H3JAH6_WOLCO|nr:hypothetical protein WOLCODRAFT_88184 [Wolfiporia cocos MD-104 SS10]